MMMVLAVCGVAALCGLLGGAYLGLVVLFWPHA